MLSTILISGCASLGDGKAAILREQLLSDTKTDLSTTPEDVERLGREFIAHKSKGAIQELDQRFANIIKLGYDKEEKLNPKEMAALIEQYWIERKKLEEKVAVDLTALQTLIDKIKSIQQAVDTLDAMESYKNQSEEKINKDASNIASIVLDILGENTNPRISEEVVKIWTSDGVPIVNNGE